MIVLKENDIFIYNGYRILIRGSHVDYYNRMIDLAYYFQNNDERPPYCCISDKDIFEAKVERPTE